MPMLISLLITQPHPGLRDHVGTLGDSFLTLICHQEYQPFTKSAKSFGPMRLVHFKTTDLLPRYKKTLQT